MMNIVTYSICTLHYYKVSITLPDKVAASLPNISIITLRLLVSSFSLFFCAQTMHGPFSSATAKVGGA